jgi:hypothetical protein
MNSSTAIFSFPIKVCAWLGCCLHHRGVAWPRGAAHVWLRHALPSLSAVTPRQPPPPRTPPPPTTTTHTHARSPLMAG